MPSEFKQYQRTQIAELREWVPGETLDAGVSISAADLSAGHPKSGDMIARNPKNHDDQWLVAADYFAANFMTPDPEAASLRKSLEAAEAERERLSGIIERDRVQVARVYAGITDAIRGYEWLRLGRGSYEYNDDRWKDEFGRCIDAALKAAKPLDRIGGDLSDSPRTMVAAMEARKGILGDLSAAHARIRELEEAMGRAAGFMESWAKLATPDAQMMVSESMRARTVLKGTK